MKYSSLIGLVAMCAVSCKAREYSNASAQSADGGVPTPSIPLQDPVIGKVFEANHKRGVLAGTSHENKPCRVESKLIDRHTFAVNGPADSPYLGHFQLRTVFDIDDTWEDRQFDFDFEKSPFKNELRVKRGSLMGQVILNDKIVVVTVQYDQDKMITKIERHVNGKLTQSCSLGK